MFESKEERMAAAKRTFDDAFDKPTYFDHKPSMEELLDLRLLAVYDAGVKEGESHVEQS